jgi:hypothetical protein
VESAQQATTQIHERGYPLLSFTVPRKAAEVREHIVCVGQGCGRLIEKPKYGQKYCSEMCKLPLAVRERRRETALRAEAQRWSVRREVEDFLRRESFPCPFCGKQPVRFQYENDEGMSPRTYISCCFGTILTDGEPEDILERWNTRSSEAS